MSDPELEIVQFAGEPMVVTPTGIAVDPRGRVFVLESHTHFRPEDYDGPRGDRVLILEDTDGDGRADKKTIFHEGLKYGMDLAFHPDGTLYLATRWAVYRLPDRDGDDRADRLERMIHLQTSGDYPHNGLSGLAFDPAGGLRFGLGENLGEPYALRGSDGRVLVGGGEGGSTYRCDARGRNLVRTSTGWWNPFGLAVDSFGRVFGTDNDPGSSPPCRLIDVFVTADYGYEYRYGRTGLNPLTTWTGDLPGTLPMIAGTGEAPCGIVAYESDGLPRRYFGSLFVPVWADHAIEIYQRSDLPRQGLTQAKRGILVHGANDFRPVDIAVAPDGSLFVSDWVLASYALHGRGKVWHLKLRKKKDEPSPPGDRLLSLSRQRREAEASSLLATRQGRERLLEVLEHGSLPEARATALWALDSLEPHDKPEGLRRALARVAADSAVSLPLRELAAVRLGAAWSPERPELLPHRLFAVWLRDHAREVTRAQLDRALRSSDPLLQHAAVAALSDPVVGHAFGESLAADHLWAVVLAARRGWRLAPDARNRWIRRAITSSSPAARLVGIKWSADERVVELRGELEALLQTRDLDYRSFRALLVCEQRLAGDEVADWPTVERLQQLLAREDLSAAVRRWTLQVAVRRGVPLDLDRLVAQVLHGPDREAAVWALARHPLPRRRSALRRVASDESLPVGVRCVAVMGLADFAEQETALLIELARSKEPAIVEEALRAFPGVDLTTEQRTALQQVGRRWPRLSSAVERAVAGRTEPRPPVSDVKAWVALLGDQPGDATVGERLFFHPKIATCAKCHSVRGRGMDVGPSMSAMSARLRSLGNDGRSWLLQQMLQPSAEMAPQYTPWLILTVDGRIFTGLPRRKGGGAEAYLGADGKEFVLKKVDIEQHRESEVSLMPEGLLQSLTIEELRDLIAYLESQARADGSDFTRPIR